MDEPVVPTVTVENKVTTSEADDDGGSAVGIGILVTFLVLCVVVAVVVGIYYYRKDKLCLKKCLTACKNLCTKCNCKRKPRSDVFDQSDSMNALNKHRVHPNGQEQPPNG